MKKIFETIEQAAARIGRVFESVNLSKDPSEERIFKLYTVKTGKNGKAYVTKETVKAYFHATDGNEKTGKAGNYNLPIEYTCKHDCECYKDGSCYACNGCYNFYDNQAQYTENYNFFMQADDETFIAYISWFIWKEKLTLFRYFTCGDIPNTRFFRLVHEIARRNPQVKFWLYTKKYSIVNSYYDENGIASKPENLTVLFSHWMNKDGSYYPMNNPYNLPTSEFIPFGREDLKAKVTHVCPCSDPDSIATCETCDKPCYNLSFGESMGLCEHSTSQTKARDAELHSAKSARKAAAKEEKRKARETRKARKA